MPLYRPDGRVSGNIVPQLLPEGYIPRIPEVGGG